MDPDLFPKPVAPHLSWAIPPIERFADVPNGSGALLVDHGRKLLTCEQVLSPSRVIQGSMLGLYDVENEGKKIHSFALEEGKVAIGPMAMVPDYDRVVLVIVEASVKSIQAISLSSMKLVGKSIEVPRVYEVFGMAGRLLRYLLNSGNSSQNRQMYPFTLDMIDGCRGILHDGESYEMGCRLVSFDIEAGVLLCKPVLTYGRNDELPVGGMAENRAGVVVPGRDWFVTGTRLGHVQIWSTRNLSKVAEWELHLPRQIGVRGWEYSQIYSLAASADGERLAVGTCAGSVHIFEIPSGHELAVLIAPYFYSRRSSEKPVDVAKLQLVQHLSFCGATPYMVAAHDSGFIRIWDTSSSRLIHEQRLCNSFLHNDRIVADEWHLSWVSVMSRTCGRMDLTAILPTASASR